jgi:DNA-binding CsgD family transcriptional regulator
MEWQGRQWAFPLGTVEPNAAAELAAGLYGELAQDGWESLRERHVREFILAVPWHEDPLLCTYSAFRSEPGPLALEPKSEGRGVVIAEPDPSIHLALVRWVNSLPEFRCLRVVTSLAAAAPGGGGPLPDLVLFNRELAAWSGRVDGEPLRAWAERGAVFGYDIVPSSEWLFNSRAEATGGYFFRRRSTAELLDPLKDFWAAGSTRRADPLVSVRSYFQRVLVGPAGIAMPGGFPDLTARENQILRELSRGRLDKEIGEILGISTWTVHNHVKNIFRKLHVHNRTEAVVKFLQG